MIPASLYIHIPWCIRKCPYCDFNSHTLGAELPEQDYLAALRADVEYEAQRFAGRSIDSVFIGGGTPSLLSASAVDSILQMVARQFSLDQDAEVTLEANPNSVEHKRFADYRRAGVNRISLGVQSFNDRALQALGRAHCAAEARQAIKAIIAAGYQRWNLDLMHGLPEQGCDEAMADLQTALAFGPEHLSWYQLTIETNTEFYSSPPILPKEDTLADIQDAGHELLNTHGLQNYEVSAYAASASQKCRHNLNYWQFGDFAAIGAGAHGKRSTGVGNDLQITRYWKSRQPQAYMDAAQRNAATAQAGERSLGPEDTRFEFMLNALRLTEGFTPALFEQRTGLAYSYCEPLVDQLSDEALLEYKNGSVRATAHGFRYLNDLLMRFLPEPDG